MISEEMLTEIFLILEEVTEEKRNIVMKFVNHQTGATTRIYIDSVLFGSEMMKYTEE